MFACDTHDLLPFAVATVEYDLGSPTLTVPVSKAHSNSPEVQHHRSSITLSTLNDDELFRIAGQALLVGTDESALPRLQERTIVATLADSGETLAVMIRVNVYGCEVHNLAPFVINKVTVEYYTSTRRPC